MKKIEVLHFGISSNPGGIETWAKKLWDHIDKEKFHFSFIDMTGEGNHPYFFTEYCDSGVTFYKITPRSVSLRRNRAEIKKLFKEHKFDILHFSVNTLSYILPVEEALKNDVKVVIHSRNGGASYNKLTRVLHQINKTRVKKFDVSRIAVSKLAGEWLFGKASFTVFNNGVDVKKFTFDTKKREAIRKEFKCDQKHVIGNVGAFLPAKNHEFIVNVFEKVCETDTNAVLWLVGEGPGKENIRKIVENKRLSDKVFFLGKRDDIDFVYAGLDCFFFPSLYEGFPNAVLEAECEGLPCIISDAITKEVIVGEDTTALSLPQGMGEWARKIIEIQKNQKKNREVGGKEVDEAGFSVEAEISRMEKLYEFMM